MDKEYAKERRKELKAAGICTTCAKRPAVKGFAKCEHCRSITKKHSDKRSKQREERRKAGVCTECGVNSVADNRRRCDECNAKIKAARLKIKLGSTTEESSRESRADSLCWHCDNYGCMWRNFLKPVKGWTAEPKGDAVCVGDGGLRTTVKTYKVKECPEFKRTKHYDNDDTWESGLVSE